MLTVLNQPAEFVVIGGAAVGSLLVSTPAKVLKMTVGQLRGAMSGAGASRGDYVDLLSMLFQIFKLVQQSGVMALEAHFEDSGQELDSVALSEVPRQSLQRRLERHCRRAVRSAVSGRRADGAQRAHAGGSRGGGFVRVKMGAATSMVNMAIPSILVKRLRDPFERLQTEAQRDDQVHMATLLQQVPVELEVRVDGGMVPAAVVAELEVGDVLEFDHSSERALNAFVNGRLLYLDKVAAIRDHLNLVVENKAES